MIYQAKEYNLSGLKGISDKTLEAHFKLYAGYVEQANLLNEKIAELLAGGKIDAEETPAYSELKRRYGFEYNGIVLHEYYFGNLTRGGGGAPGGQSAFTKAARQCFGSYELWKTDFVSTGKMRGIGWAICYRDPHGRITNHWVSLHENGNVAGYTPILVMDVWEHAYLLDYKPSEKAKYIDAFFFNIDWNAVNSRLGLLEEGILADSILETGQSAPSPERKGSDAEREGFEPSIQV